MSQCIQGANKLREQTLIMKAAESRVLSGLSPPRISSITSHNLWMCRDNSGQQHLFSSEKVWSHRAAPCVSLKTHQSQFPTTGCNNRHVRRKTGLILWPGEIFRREINLVAGSLPMAKGWNWVIRKVLPTQTLQW